MFVRRKKLDENRTKIQVVKSVRDGKKVRQRVIRHVGTATSEVQAKQLEYLARIIIEEIEQEKSGQTALFSPTEFAGLLDQSQRARQDPNPLGIDLADCREESRVSVGIREAFGTLYSYFGWDRLFGSRRMSANRIIKELVLARLAQPLSRRSMVRELDYDGELSLNLDYVYRSMDLIDDAQIEAICQRSLDVAKKLFPEPVTAIFYYTTSLYFESEKDDGLKLKGYSGGGKSHRAQFLFALLMTPEGIPIDYELFPRDKYEGDALITALESLERRHVGVDLTVVADAKAINKENEVALRKRGIPYILSTCLKSRPAKQKEKIFDPDGYSAWGRDEYSGSISRIQRIKDGESKLIVTYSPRRARNRTRGIEKLQTHPEKNRQPDSYSNQGCARFLDLPGGQVSLNEDKIADVVRWGGLQGIVAWGCDDADPCDLIIQYRKLSEIKDYFRTNKHDLSIRPIFHWKEHRVRAHIAICYMAFCCLQHLRHRLAIQGYRMSPERIRRALNELQISILYEKSGPRKVGLPSSASADAKQIYRTLRLNWNLNPFTYTPPRKAKWIPC